MEGAWSCYRGGQFNSRENGHVQEVVTLMEGEWSCYRGDHFNEGEWSCYGSGQFNGGRMVVTEGASLMERE